MKDTYYFQHDYNARNDLKIINLVRKEGAAGYGIYWMVIEMLYEAGGVMPLECEGIAFALHSQCDEVEAVIYNFGLFEINESETSFTSRRVLENIDIKNQKSKKASESAGKRWDVMRSQCERNANALRTQCDSVDIEMRTQCDSNAKKGKEIKEIKELNEMKETKKEEKAVFVFDDKSLETGETNLDIENVDDEPECTETVTEQYQAEINSKPLTGLQGFMQKGRELRNQPIPQPEATHEERNAETKKRQKVMEWFLKYISIHPKKTKRFLVEQIWCDMFLNPTLSDEEAKELYGKIISSLRIQKDKHPRDDANYTFFPAADAWLRDGRWMDEVETIQPETLEEQSARLKKKFDEDQAVRKSLYEREGIPFE